MKVSPSEILNPLPKNSTKIDKIRKKLDKYCEKINSRYHITFITYGNSVVLYRIQGVLINGVYIDVEHKIFRRPYFIHYLIIKYKIYRLGKEK